MKATNKIDPHLVGLLYIGVSALIGFVLAHQFFFPATLPFLEFIDQPILGMDELAFKFALTELAIGFLLNFLSRSGWLGFVLAWPFIFFGAIDFVHGSGPLAIECGIVASSAIFSGLAWRMASLNIPMSRRFSVRPRPSAAPRR
jgi:hypothetical protein